jgi:cytochrome c peroxidase
MLVALGLAGGCREVRDFDDAEMSKLLSFKLTAQALPVDSSNRYGDSVPAAQLGKRLFFDPGMSGPLGAYNDGVRGGSLGKAGETGKISCASCHDPQQGGADRRSSPPATSLGAGFTSRNSPTIINAAFSPWQHWDGRKDSLWSQVLGPSESAAECNGSRLRTAHYIYANHRQQYEAVFGEMPDLSNTDAFPAEGKPGTAAWDGMTAENQEAANRVFANYGKAIAAYERRLTSLAFEPSPFDRYLDGDLDALSPAAIRGAKLFVGRASCNECHSGPAFTNNGFHNIGAPQVGEHVPTVDAGRWDAASLLRDDIFNRSGTFSDDPRAEHLPRAASDGDLGRFKTPTLRNVSRTAPYLHDGAYTTLWDMVDHYNFGGGTGSFSGQKDPALVPLLLDDREMGELVAFLEALTDGPPLPTSDFPEGLIAPPPAP